MTVGVLGGGQLGRMLALAGYPLGLDFVFLDPTPRSPAGQVAAQIVGAYDDRETIEELARRAGLVTYEFENVPVEATRRLADRVPVLPPPAALEVSQDRLLEKRLFRELGIATADFVPVDRREDLQAGLSVVGLPAVLKTRREGYDGKGQAILGREEDTRAAWERLGGQPLLLESFVAFSREVSVLAVRSTRGETASYPLVENHHRRGILRLSLAPAPEAGAALEAEAREAASRVMARLDYAGVLTLEFFEQGGRLLANEMAPRVHNSGHWTIEGAETSQFENHLRAILGLSLGSVAPRGRSAMVNLIGELPPLVELAAVPGARVHFYGKSPRPGRKLGHVTVTARDSSTLMSRLENVTRLAPLPEDPQRIG